MSIIVSGRHMQVTDALRQHAEEKLGVILAEYHKITSVRVILEMQKGHQQVEIVVHGKHLEIEAKHQSFDMYESIDQATVKVATQLRRHFDKIHDHHKGEKTLAELEPEPEAAE